MKQLFSRLTVAALLAATSAFAEEKVPLKTDLPKPAVTGTPAPIPDNIKNRMEPELKIWPRFLVPAGTVNLAKGKKVTASDKGEPVTGSLDFITDGDKAAEDGSWVEIAPGKQWVQIDLATEAEISAVVVWHYHSQVRVYHDVVAQIADDAAFTTNVTTIFDDSETGKDRPYIETAYGKLMDAKGVKGRYVRLYSNGNTATRMNDYTEVEVFGKPVK